MREFTPWFFLTAGLWSLVQVSGSPSTYRAAVVEYHPIRRTNERESVEANVLSYKNLMTDAKRKGAEIIVFPEHGLLTKETRSYIPDPSEKVVPCDSANPKFTKTVKDLSCASKENSIYSVINLVEKRDCEIDDEHCPVKGYYVFNTNVVFDRKGMVVARYAKYNLFDEPFTDHPHDPEMVFFDTDFGVRFGTFICFDILFSTPGQRLVQQYQITDFVFTTYWFSELPFLTALQAQRGWAESNNVNLLASGVNEPDSGSGGSGIYNGRFGHLVQVMLETPTTKLLVADVPRIQERSSKEGSTFSEFSEKTKWSNPVPDVSSPTPEVTAESNFNLLSGPIHLYTSEVVGLGKKFSKSICSNQNFCCDFEIEMEKLKMSSNYTCRAMVFNGVRRFGESSRGGVQACGVVMCSGPDIKNCTSRLKDISGVFKFQKIKIKGNFNLRNSFQMPSTLTDGNGLKPLPNNKYVFKRAEKDESAAVSLELVWPVIDLHTFAIWGRDFTKDKDPEVPESGSPLPTCVPALLLSSLVTFLLLFR